MLEWHPPDRMLITFNPKDQAPDAESKFTYDVDEEYLWSPDM